MRLKCLPLLLIITAAAAVVNADSFNSEEDGLKPSLSCILWGDAGCRRKCALLCTAFGCLSSSPQCNTVFCDCREKLPIKCLGVVPNASNSPDLPPDVTFKQLLVVKFMRTPVFRDLDKVMPTVPELELEVMKFLYTTDLSGKELKQEMKRRFPSLKYLFRRLRPRPLAQLDPNVSAEVMKEGINVEPEEPPTRSYFSSWLKPKPTKFDVNSPENQKRIINLIKKLPYKHDVIETFEVLRDSPEKPLYQNICRYFLKEGMLSPDGVQIVKPTSDPAELEKKVQNDDVIRQLQDRINESNEQRKNRKRKRVNNSGENSSEENDAKKPKLDETPGQSPNNGWWSPSLWGPGGNSPNNSGPGQNPTVGPTAADKPSGGWWWGWGNGKGAPKDGGVDKSNMPPPLPSAGQSPNQGPNSGGSWKWPSWNWPAGSGPQGANMPNPDQSPVQSGPSIGSPWGNNVSQIATPIPSSNSGRSLDSPEPESALLKEDLPNKTPKERKRHKLRKIPDTKDFEEDVFPDMGSIDETLGKPKKKHRKHGKHKKHKKRKHHPESSESDSDESSSEEISPSGTPVPHKKRKKHHKKPSESDESSSEEISPTGTPTKHKKRKKHRKKPSDSDGSSSEEITPPGAPSKPKKRKKHHKKSLDSDDSSAQEIAAPGTPSKNKKRKKHHKKPSDSDESSSEEYSLQNTPSKHPKKKKHHKKSLDGDESPTKVISPPGSDSEPKKKRKHKKKPSDSDESSSEETTSPGSQPELKTRKKHRKPKNKNDTLTSQAKPEDVKKNNSDSDEDDSDEDTAKKIPSIGGLSGQKTNEPMVESSPDGKINKHKRKKDKPSQANSDESSSEEISPDGTVTKHKKKKHKKNKPLPISSQSQQLPGDKDSDESSPEKMVPDAGKTKHHKKKKVLPSLPSDKKESIIDDSSMETLPSSPDLVSNPKKKKNVSTISSASISSSQLPDEPSNDSKQFKKPKKTQDATSTQEVLPENLTPQGIPKPKKTPNATSTQEVLPENVTLQGIPGSKLGDSPLVRDDVHVRPVMGSKLEKLPGLESIIGHDSPISLKVNGPLQQSLKNMPNSLSTPLILSGIPTDVPNLQNHDMHDDLTPEKGNGSVQQLLKNMPNAMLTQEGTPRDISNPSSHDLQNIPTPKELNGSSQKLLNNMPMMLTPITSSDKSQNTSKPNTRDIQGDIIPAKMKRPLQKLLKDEPNSMSSPMSQISSGKSPDTSTVIGSNPLKGNDGLLANPKYPTSDSNKYPADIILPTQQLSPQDSSPQKVNKQMAPSSDTIANAPSSMFSLGSLWPTSSEPVNGSPELKHMDSFSPTALNNVKSSDGLPSSNVVNSVSGNPSVLGGLIPQEPSKSLLNDGIKPSSPNSSSNKSPNKLNSPAKHPETSVSESPLLNSKSSQSLSKENPSPGGSPVKGGEKSDKSDIKTPLLNNSPSQLLDAQNGLVASPKGNVDLSPADKIPSDAKQTPLINALDSLSNSPTEKKAILDAKPTAPANLLAKLLNKQIPSTMFSSTPSESSKNLDPEMKSPVSKDPSTSLLSPSDSIYPKPEEIVAEKSPYVPGTPYHSSPMMHKGGRDVPDHMADVPQSLKQLNNSKPFLNNPQLAGLSVPLSNTPSKLNSPSSISPEHDPLNIEHPSGPSTSSSIIDSSNPKTVQLKDPSTSPLTNLLENKLNETKPSKSALTNPQKSVSDPSVPGISSLPDVSLAKQLLSKNLPPNSVPSDEKLKDSSGLPNSLSNPSSPSAINSADSGTVQSKDSSTSPLAGLLKNKLDGKPSDSQKSISDPSVSHISSLPDVLLAKKLLSENLPPGSVPSDKKIKELVDKLKSENHPSSGVPNSLVSNPSSPSPLTDSQKSISDPSVPHISSLPDVLLAKKLLSENLPPGSVPSDKKIKELVDKLKSENHPSSGVPNSLDSNPSSPSPLTDSQKSISDPSVPHISSLPDVLLAKKLLSENLPPGSVPSDKKIKELVDKLKSENHPSSGVPSSPNSADPSIVQSTDPSASPNVLLAKKLLSENLPPGSVPSDKKIKELVDKLKSETHLSPSPTNSSVSNPSNGTVDVTKQPLQAPEDKYLENLVNQLKSGDPSLHLQSLSNNDPSSITIGPTVEPNDTILQGLANKLKPGSDSSPTSQSPSSSGQNPLPIKSNPNNKSIDQPINAKASRMPNIPSTRDISTSSPQIANGASLLTAAPSQPSEKMFGGGSDSDTSGMPEKSPPLLNKQLGNLKPKGDASVANLPGEGSLSQPNTLLSPMSDIAKDQSDQNLSNSSPLVISPENIMNSMVDKGLPGALSNNSPTSSSFVSPKSQGLKSPTSTDSSNAGHTPGGTTPIIGNLPEKLSVSAPPSVGVFTSNKEIPVSNNSPISELSSKKDVNPSSSSNVSNSPVSSQDVINPSKDTLKSKSNPNVASSNDGPLVSPQTNLNSPLGTPSGQSIISLPNPSTSSVLPSTSEKNASASPTLESNPGIGGQPKGNGKHDVSTSEKDELKPSLKQMPISSLSPILMPTDGNPFETLLSKPEHSSSSTPSLNNKELPSDDSNATLLPSSSNKNSQPLKSIEKVTPTSSLSPSGNSLPLLNIGRSLDNENSLPSDHLVDKNPTIEHSITHESGLPEQPVGDGLSSPNTEKMSSPLTANPKFASLLDKLKNAGSKPQKNIPNSSPQITNTNGFSTSPSQDQLMLTNVKPSISNDASIPALESSPMKNSPSLANLLSPDNNVKSPSSVPLVKPLNNLPSSPVNVQDSTIPQPSTLKDNMNSVIPPGSKNVLPLNQPSIVDHNEILPTLLNGKSTPLTSNSPPITSENLQPSLNSNVLDLKQPTINPAAETKEASQGTPNVSPSKSTPVQNKISNLSPDVLNSIPSDNHMLPLSPAAKLMLPTDSPPSLGQTSASKLIDGSPTSLNQIPSDNPLLPPSSITKQTLPTDSTPSIGNIPSLDRGSPGKLEDGSPISSNPIPSDNTLFPPSPVIKQALPSGSTPLIENTPSLGQTSTGSTPTIGNVPSLDHTSAGKSKDDSLTPLNPIPSDNSLLPLSSVTKQPLPTGSPTSLGNTPLGQISTGKSKDTTPNQSNSPVGNTPPLGQTPTGKSENIAPDQSKSKPQSSFPSMPTPITITPVHPDSINNPALPTPLATTNNLQLPNPSSGILKSPINPTTAPSLLSSPISKPVQSSSTPPPSLLPNPIHSAPPSHPSSPFDELDDSIPWLDDEVDISDDSMEFLHNRPKPSFKSSTKSPSNVLPKQKPSNTIENVPPLPLQAPNLPPTSPLVAKDLNNINNTPNSNQLPSIISPKEHPVNLQNPNTPLLSAPSPPLLDNTKVNSPLNLPGSPSFSPQSNTPQTLQQQPITNTPSSLLPSPLSSLPDSAGPSSPNHPSAAVQPSLPSPDPLQNSPLQTKNIPASPLGSENPSSLKIKLPPGADNSSPLPSNSFNNPSSTPISGPLALPSVSPHEPPPSIPSPVITPPPDIKKPLNFNSLFTSEELPDELHSEEHPSSHDLKPSPPPLTAPSPLSPPSTAPPPGFKKPSLDLNKLFTSEELPSDLVSDEHHNPSPPAILPSPPSPPQITPPSPLFTKPFGMNNNMKSPLSPLITPQINNNIGKPSIFASFDDLPPSPPSFNTFKAPMLTPPMANFDIPITLPKSAPLPSQSGPGTDDEASRKNGGQNWRQKLFQKKAFQPLS
ncbi:uncharacterized protein LOC135845681 [Planococcus citri]|uniref:uncharacterized protein LOC135845681 n=1 Tax=Planococcus citri TaxID=170843 RepID=UPI0031F981DE